MGLAAADQALIARELVRLTALALGESVTFTPLRASFPATKVRFLRVAANS